MFVQFEATSLRNSLSSIPATKCVFLTNEKNAINISNLPQWVLFTDLLERGTRLLFNAKLVTQKVACWREIQ